jgi:hypothetical protein
MQQVFFPFRLPISAFVAEICGDAIVENIHIRILEPFPWNSVATEYG